jgi:hypothetical protein
MNDAKRLPLDSPLWNRFETFGVVPRRIPLILKKLTKDSVDPMDPAFNELVSGIFHQYSLTDATYAALPYLADIHDRFANKNPNLFYLAANIAASANVDQIDLPPEVREAFLETLIGFATIAISKVVTEGHPVKNVYDDCVAAVAFSQHCCGKLLMDVLEAEPEGTKHTSLICPQCQQHMEVVLFEEGAVVIEPGREPHPPEPPKPLARPPLRSYPERRPNPWHAAGSFLAQGLQSVAMSDTERLYLAVATSLCERGFGPHVLPEDAFSLIGSVLLAHGFASSARRFFRLCDIVACIKCNCAFVAAKGWWGCVSKRG